MDGAPARRRPAYSDAFALDALRLLPSILPAGQISPDWAWARATGKCVRVAVIDSGIDADHPGISGPPVRGYVAVSEDNAGTPTYVSAPHSDLVGHGTACAGIIRSIAPDCELFSIRALGPRLGGTGAVFAAAIRWAIDNRMHVCNLSLGTTRKDFFGVLHELADAAYFDNVMLVCAANNLPIPSFPSTFGSVISVAAHDRKDPYIV